MYGMVTPELKGPQGSEIVMGPRGRTLRSATPVRLGRWPRLPTNNHGVRTTSETGDEMGTITIEGIEDAIPQHQHPGLVIGTYRVHTDNPWKMRPADLTSYVEHSLPQKRWHVHARRTADGWLTLRWFYAARGAWPNDIRKRTRRIELTDAYLLDEPKRYQLCEHRGSTANCVLDDDRVDTLIGWAMRHVREDPLWTPTRQVEVRRASGSS
jgi:hypothetical protein